MDNGTFLSCWYARSAAVSGRPRCARYGLGRRSLMSKGPCPLTARCGMGRLCGERRADGASVASAFMRKKRGLRQAAAHIAGPCVRPAPSEPPPRAPAPTARAVRPHQPRNPHRASVSSARRARREASALWAVGPKAQSDPKRGSETMSATGREARMIEQPGARNAPPRTATLTTPEPTFPHPPSEVWRAAALQNAFRIRRHARWIRQPCASKATLRRPPPGEPAAKPPAK